MAWQMRVRTACRSNLSTSGHRIMGTVWIIFKKELLDTLRDRRTVAVMVLVPLLLLPLIIALVTQLQAQLIISARAPLIRVALVEQGRADGFED